MPSPISRIARRYIRSALRTKIAQRAATGPCRYHGIKKPDDTYNLSDQDAIACACAIARNLTIEQPHLFGREPHHNAQN